MIQNLDARALGDRVRDGRRALKVSQREVAEACGLRRQAVAAIERAQVRDPGIQTLHQIAYVLGTSLAELVDPEHAKPNGHGV